MSKNNNIVNIVERSLRDIKPYSNNPRKITEKAITYVKNSILKFGYNSLILIDKNNEIVAGHTRFKALCMIQLESPNFMDFNHIPCRMLDNRTAQQIKGFRMADNKTGEFSEWDDLKLENEIGNLDIDMRDFGFSLDIDKMEEEKKEEKKYKSKKEVTCPECGAVFII